jgi:hypothetical protein
MMLSPIAAYPLGRIAEEALARPDKATQGPRISYTEARALRLPDKTLFGDASPKQLVAWFILLVEMAGRSPHEVQDVLKGMDLREEIDRWYVLLEVLELPGVHDVLSGKVSLGIGRILTEEDLVRLLSHYGLHLRRSPQQLLYGVRQKPKKVRVPLGPESRLAAGFLTEGQVLKRLEQHGLVPVLEGEV